MKAMMVDIEAFSTVERGAAIIQIGYAVFDPFDRSCRIQASRKFSTTPPPEARYDLDTCLWWMLQSKEARESIAATKREGLYSALGKLFEDYRGLLCEQVWAQGVKYDINNIEYWAKALKLPIPWEYNHVRDARSCMSRAGYKPDRAMYIEHDAEADACYQAICVMQHFARVQE